MLVNCYRNRLLEVQSPTHEITAQFTDAQLRNEARIAFKNQEIPNKDFVLQFQTDEAQNIILSRSPRDDEQAPFCAFLSLIPSLSSTGPAEEAKSEVDSLPKASERGEFIFLIDRSGSMSGQRFEMAKTALLLFIKSLPVNSYFNIVSFGSKFKSMYPVSVLCGEETVDEALKSVGRMDADMGGTEIYKPLSLVFESMPVVDGLPRNVFLLTDGDVTNTKQVIQLIRDWSHSMQLYALGIGSGASQELIKGGAEAGNGCAELVSDNSLIQEKVIVLLKRSLAKKFLDFRLEYDAKDVAMILPDINKISFLRENQPLQAFIFLNRGVQQTSLRLKINGKEVMQQQINTQDMANVLGDSTLHKLGYYRMVKKMVQNNKQEGDVFDDIYFARQKDIDNLQREIVDVCVKYQLLTEVTAFVCEVKYMTDENKQQRLVHMDIPLPKSVDHISLRSGMKNLGIRD